MIRSLAVTLLVTATAHAQPHVELGRCASYDTSELQHAIARDVHGESAYAVVIECADLVTAKLRLSPEPPDGPVEREVNLGEVEGALRPKLLALAIAELADIATGLPPPKPPASPPNSPTTTPPANSADQLPATQHVPNTLAAREPVAVVEPERSDVVVPWSLAVHAGTRAYLHEHSTVIGTVAIDVIHRPYRIGIEAGMGQHFDPSRDSIFFNSQYERGLVRGWLGTATGAVELVCALGVCVTGNVALGGTLIHTHIAEPADKPFVQSQAIDPYVALSISLEYTHAVAGVSFTLAIESGYTWGADFLVYGEPVIRFDDQMLAGHLAATF
ncbi:MAG: hypothetical protein QM831_27230 [Kofleriaceae bacterium]